VSALGLDQGGLDRARSRQIVRRPAGASVAAPGHGLQPWTRPTIAGAGSRQSSQPSTFRSRGASVASASRCGVGVSVPSRASVSISTRAPITDRRSPSSPAVSPGRIDVRSDRRIGPVSMPSSIWMVVTPVSASPRISAHAIGAAPRYLGRSEAWTLMDPRAGMSRTAVGRIWPKATTTATSARTPRSGSSHRGSRSRSGWSTGTPAATARSFTGGGATCRPRPAGRSGCVTTATTSWEASSASSVGSAKRGVP